MESNAQDRRNHVFTHTGIPQKSRLSNAPLNCIFFLYSCPCSLHDGPINHKISCHILQHQGGSCLVLVNTISPWKLSFGNWQYSHQECSGRNINQYGWIDNIHLVTYIVEWLVVIAIFVHIIVRHIVGWIYDLDIFRKRLGRMEACFRVLD